jgi:hypothetical protein
MIVFTLRQANNYILIHQMARNYLLDYWEHCRKGGFVEIKFKHRQTPDRCKIFPQYQGTRIEDIKPDDLGRYLIWIYTDHSYNEAILSHSDIDWIRI